MFLPKELYRRQHKKHEPHSLHTGNKVRAFMATVERATSTVISKTPSCAATTNSELAFFAHPFASIHYIIRYIPQLSFYSFGISPNSNLASLALFTALISSWSVTLGTFQLPLKNLGGYSSFTSPSTCINTFSG